MRVIKATAIMGACLVGGWIAALWQPSLRSSGKLTSLHAGLTIEQVQLLTTLVTTQIDVADVQETVLEGRAGSIKVALIVKGSLQLGVDLSRARLEAVDAQARCAVLILPQPHLASVRIDHERTRVFAITETGLWMLTPGSNRAPAVVIERAYQQAQRYVAQAGSDAALLARSRTQAEAAMGTFFAAMGWQVAVRWSD